MYRKLKILFTIPNFDTAGSGIPLLKIAQKLDKNLFEPHIACLHSRGELFKDVQKSGIKVHIIDMYKNARPIIRMIKECYQLSKVFKEINPNIIHSYHYAADYTEPLAAKMAGIKWVYTKKNMSWIGPSFRGWKLRSWLADGIICQNTEMLKKFFPNLGKAKLIPIGVDSQIFKKKPVNNNIKNQWKIADNIRVIISVAHLVPVKGIEILINAFELLADKYPNWRLMIIGDDSTQYAAELKKDLLNKPVIMDKVIFTGRQNNIREFLDMSEIYVQPTLKEGRMEGAPIAILEAMANEKVIIGSDIPGINDQLAKFPEHLYKPGNITDLKERLVYFMSNKKTMNNKIGKIFSHYVNKNYDIAIEKDNIELFYKNLF